MSIGDNIRRIRKKRNITQRELGEKLGGISQQQIGQWENGNKNPKIETVSNIAKALGCSIAELYDEPLDMAIGYNSNNTPVIIDGVINPEIFNISEWLDNANEELPFTILTEGEKLIIYFNSLNDEGKDKVFEYMELLLSSKQYRNLNITPDRIKKLREQGIFPTLI